MTKRAFLLDLRKRITLSISQKLQYVLDNFQGARSAYSKLPSGKRMLDFEVVRALTLDIPKEIARQTGSALKIVGSAGKGNFAEIPHICGFDLGITKSAQEGYYIVYLFSADSKRVYLSLNQGWTSFLRRFHANDAKIEIAKCARIARGLLKLSPGFTGEKIELNSTNGKLGSGYELGNICSKVYPTGNLPDDRSLMNDWNALSNVYHELREAVGVSLVDFGITFDDECFQESIQIINTGRDLPTGPLPRPIQRQKSSSLVWDRSPEVSAIALRNALYLCEYNNGHSTFISHRSGHQFVEAHHLIPLEFQSDFENSLDIPENVLSLCPNCHRAFHHSKSETKIEMINWFFDRRCTAMSKRGIIISKQLLAEYYTRTKKIESEEPKSSLRV